jgi:hypothetical protein
MSDAAKIALSPEELELVNDTRWILTKQQITAKVYALLGEAAEDLRRIAAGNAAIPEAVRMIPPKIARGENYRQLPYVMLDYPRFFGQPDTLALRTFFWWGHFFSVSLQVAGRWLPGTEHRLMEMAEGLAEQGYQLCVYENPWEHALEKDNYIPMGEWISNGRMPSAAASGFLKITRVLPLQQWASAPQFIRETGEQLLSLLPVDQAPSR